MVKDPFNLVLVQTTVGNDMAVEDTSLPWRPGICTGLSSKTCSQPWRLRGGWRAEEQERSTLYSGTVTRLPRSRRSLLTRIAKEPLTVKSRQAYTLGTKIN